MDTIFVNLVGPGEPQIYISTKYKFSSWIYAVFTKPRNLKFTSNHKNWYPGKINESTINLFNLNEKKKKKRKLSKVFLLHGVISRNLKKKDVKNLFQHK